MDHKPSEDNLEVNNYKDELPKVEDMSDTELDHLCNEGEKDKGSEQTFNY